MARQYYMQTQDAAGTLERLPGGRPVERQLLTGLVRQETDLLGALRSVSVGGCVRVHA